MACDVPKILEKNNVVLNSPNLKKVGTVFSNPKSTTLDKKFILNSLLHDAIKKRNSLLKDVYPKGIPAKFQVTLSGIPVTQADVDQKARNARNAAASIMAGDTLKVGRDKSTIGQFIDITKKKLNVLFNKSLTLIEYMESAAYETFLKTASKEDVSVFQYLLFNSRKLEEFFYGKDRTNPIIDYMVDSQAGKTAYKFAVTINDENRTDLFKYLVKNGENGSLEVDPLVLEAINLAIYNWQSTQARNTYFNGDAEINAILGRDSKAEVSRAEREMFAEAGVVRAAVIESIGKEAFDLLGFEAKKDVDGTFAPNLKLALGELAVAYMLENDMLGQKAVPREAFAHDDSVLFESQQDQTSRDSDTLFLNVKDKELMDQLSETRRQTEVPKDQFGMDSYKVFPSKTPIEAVTEFMKRTTQKITKQTARVIKSMQKDKWEVKTTVADKLFSISEGLRNSILGIVEDVEGEHITVQSKIEAQNNKIEQTLENFLDFSGKLKSPDSPFYFKYFVSRVGRIFIDNNTINPLQDKIVRHLVGLKHFNISVNSTALRTQYKLAVAQAFGFGIDKNDLDTSLKAFEDILTDNAAAIDALRADTLSAEQEAIVKEALEGKEGIHTFEALLSLRDFSETEAFETNLAIETDAVTSGVAIGMMQSLLDTAEDFASIGVMTDGGTTTYASWRSKIGNLDLYQKLTQVWSRIVGETVKADPDAAPVAIGIRGIIEPFVSPAGIISEIGRKFSKTPLMVTNYGAAIENAKNFFSSTVLAKFYEQITKADNPQIFYDHMASIIGEELDIDPEVKPQNFVLTGKQERAFRKAVTDVYGTSLESALKERLGEFIRFRDTINKAFNAMFGVFETRYNAAIEQKQKAIGKRNMSIEEQEAVLESVRKYFPVVKGPLSEGLDDAVLIMKGGLRRQYTTAHKSQQQYSRPINNTGGVASITSHSKAYVYEAPGAAATVSQIHNMDSAIQQAMLTAVEAMNVHDAGLYSLGDVDTGSKTYNQAFYDINTTFSILEATWESYKRIMSTAKDTMTKKDKKFALELKELVQEVTEARVAFIADNPSVTISHVAHATPDSVYTHGTIKGKMQDVLDKMIPAVFATVERPVVVKKEEVSKQTKKDINEANNRRKGAKQARDNKEVEETDDLFTFLRKKGGIDVTTDVGLAQILKPYNKEQKTVGLPGIAQFKAGHTGIDMSTAAQLATDAGYIELTRQGNVDETALLDILVESAGQEFYNDAGNEAIAQAELDNEFLEQQDLDEQRRVEEFQARKTTPQKPIDGEQDSLFGSSSKTIDFDAFVALLQDTITSDSMLPLFEQLVHIGSKLDPVEHTERLTEVLANVIRLQGEIDLKVGESDSESFGAQRTFSDGQQDIHILGSASTYRNNAQLSAQEIYVHELVHAITEAGIDSNASIRKALKRLYTQAEKHFSYVDFLPDTVGPHTRAEIKTAKETYDYIFNSKKGATGVKSTGSANPYLHEFVAYGLTNAAFIKKLATIPIRTKSAAPTNLWERLVDWYNSLLAYVTDRMHGVEFLSSDVALRKLVDKMLATQNKNKGTLLRMFEGASGMNQTAINFIMARIFRPMVNYRNSPKPTHIPGRVLHTMASILDVEVYNKAGQIIKQVSRNIGLTEKSFIVKLVREVQGLKDSNGVWHSLLRLSKKVVDQARVHIAVNVAEQIKENFHTPVSKEEGDAIYKVVMKTDLVSLLNTYQKDKYTPDMIISLLKNPATLGKTIADLEVEIKKAGFGKNAKYYLQQAFGLGKLLTLGSGFVAGQMRNAHVIASMKNTQNDVQGDVVQAEQMIDELATLHALNNLTNEVKEQAAEVYKRENAVDGVQNGITRLLHLHNLNKEQSLKHLFSGNKMQMEKGYTKETFNPSIDVKISPKKRTQIDPITGEIEVIDLEAILNKEGYIRISDDPLPKDPLDPSPDVRYAFVSRNNPNATWVKSIVSLTAEKHQGTAIDEVFSTVDSNTSYIDGQKAIQDINKQINDQIKRQFFGKETTSTLLPIINDEGVTTNFRYVMSEHVKDTVMERDNRFDYAMGRMFGSIQDKTNSKKVNQMVLNIAKEDYDENILKEPDEFVELGPGSTDPELAEIYSLLPKDMKQAMTAVWGEGNPMFIRAEYLNLIFGFRKLRLKDSNSFIGSAVQGVNEALTWVMRTTFFPEAPNADIGKLWAEVVTMAKEMIVVKSGVILLPNFISNNYILLMRGVFPGKIATYQTEALLELDQYHKDLRTRDILARELKANTELTDKERSKMEVKLARLNTDLFNNPVSVLLDEGVFQSIIEDLDFEEDIYTSRAKLGAKVEAVANKFLHEYVVSAAKFAFFTKDTKPYQVLLKATQVSDFIARYALYKHRMDNTPADVKTEDERNQYYNSTINEIVETFVNYDVPTSKELQWINDMGLMMFTKFYFRIQKIILKMFMQKQPKKDKNGKDSYFINGRVISGLLVQRMFGDVEDIGDSFIGFSLLNRVNGPMDIIDEANDVALWEHLT